jgi:pilus assembly protein Flp/PilA
MMRWIFHTGGKESAMLARKLKQFWQDESGLSAVEYGLLVAGIAVGLYTLIHNIGTSLQAIYTSVGTDLSSAAP